MSVSTLNFQALFETSPALQLILSADPSFTIMAVTDAYASATMTKRNEIIGQQLFQVFPDNPDDPSADGVRNLHDSLHRVLENRVPDRMDIQKYDIRKPDGSFEVRYWSPLNTPVLNAEGKITGIIHQVENVTEVIRLKDRGIEQEKLLLSYDTARRLIETERKNFQKLFRQTPELVCILIGPEHRFDFVNDAHIKVLGFNATGMTVRESQPESVEIHNILDDVYQSGETAELFEIPVTIQNRIRYFNLTYSARQDECGDVDGIMILGTEVTDQVMAREVLQKKQTELDHALKDVRTLLDAAPSFFGLVHAVSGRVIICNDLALQVINKKAEDVFGEIFWECPWWSKLPESAALVQNAIQNGAKGQTTEFDVPYMASLPGRPEEIRWVTFCATPAKGDSGSDRTIAVSGVEITERRAVEKSLEKAIRSRDEFLSIASHELKTPLTGMKIQSQMFSRSINKNPSAPLDPAKAIRMAEGIDQGINRLIRLVDDMLDISRIQIGKLTFQREPVELLPFINQTLERLRPELENAGIELRTQLEQGLQADLDHFRIEQVLTNLTTNVIRYAPQNPLDVTLKKEGEKAVIVFEDHGPGIKDSDQERIFVQFERLVSANDVSGMGLGLYICKKIIDGHAGSIRAITKEKSGACFIIELPLL